MYSFESIKEYFVIALIACIFGSYIALLFV